MGNFNNKYIREIKDVHGDNFDWNLFDVNKFNQKINKDKSKSNVFTLKEILSKECYKPDKLELSLKELNEYKNFETYDEYENYEYYKLFSKLKNSEMFEDIDINPMFYIYQSDGSDNKMTSSNKVILIANQHFLGFNSTVGGHFGVSRKLFIIEKFDESGKDKEYDIIEADKNCEYYMKPTPNKNYPIIKKIYIEDLNNYKGNTIHFTINYKGLIDYSFDVNKIKFNSKNKTILFKNKILEDNITIEDLDNWSDFKLYLKISKELDIKISLTHGDDNNNEEIFIDDYNHKIEPLIERFETICKISKVPTFENVKKIVEYYKENKIHREPFILNQLNLISKLFRYKVNDNYELEKI